VGKGVFQEKRKLLEGGSSRNNVTRREKGGRGRIKREKQRKDEIKEKRPLGGRRQMGKREKTEWVCQPIQREKLQDS